MRIKAWKLPVVYCARDDTAALARPSLDSTFVREARTRFDVSTSEILHESRVNPAANMFKAANLVSSIFKSDLEAKVDIAILVSGPEGSKEVTSLLHGEKDRMLGRVWWEISA